MKVTVIKYLNVRVGKPSLNAPCFQYIAPGSELEIDGKVYKGDRYDGIDTWLKDNAGNYYWSGGINSEMPIAEFLKQVNRQAEARKGFKWFSELKVQAIWDQFGEKGDRARVAVLDTGYVFSNNQISSKIKTSKLFIDNDRYPGIRLVMDDQSNESHGNRCACLIGAGNTSDLLVGIAPACEMIVGKISIDKELLDFNYIMEGIKWAIAQNTDIISISYAYEDLTPAEIPALSAALSQMTAGKNVLIFVSAGNSGSPQRSADLYPASFDDCVSVGASGQGNQISRLTVLSNKTVIHAPGENIESYGNSTIPSPESGTSYATPIVAGVCALAVSFLKKKIGKWDKTELLKKLYASGDSIAGNPGKKVINPVQFFNSL